MSRPTLPAISAGAANRTTCQSGKFHGMTASTTPSGGSGAYACDAPTAAGVDRLVGEEALGVLGVEAHALRALGRLGPRGRERLAHLEGHDPRDRARSPRRAGPRRARISAARSAKRGAPPRAGTPRRPRAMRGVDLLVGVRLEGLRRPRRSPGSWSRWPCRDCARRARARRPDRAGWWPGRGAPSGAR